MSKQGLLWRTCALGAFTMFASPAWAQNAASSDTTAFGDIVVTAERREANIQDVPLAISAFTSEQRDEIGITSIQDIANFTPGFSYNTLLDRPNMRGIGRLTNNFAVDNGVSTYSDGVWTNSVTEASRSPLFTERVEVLRGPQGTLYGRNSIGGAVNVISRRPTDELYAEGRAQFGAFGFHQIEGAVSGPITDTFRYRLVAAAVEQEEGYFENVADGSSESAQDRWGAEAQFEWDVTPDLSIWGRYSRWEWNDTYRSAAFLGNYDPGLFAPASLGPNAGYGLTIAHTQVGSVTTNPARNDHRLFNTNTPSSATLDDNDQIALNADWDLGGVTAHYIGGYQHYLYNLTQDFDNTPVTSYVFPGSTVVIRPESIFHYIEDRTWSSHEFNLTSDGDGPVNWIVGAYYFQDEYQQPFYINSPNQTQLFNPVYQRFCTGSTNCWEDYTDFTVGDPPLGFFPYSVASAAAPNPRGDYYSTNQAAENSSRAVYGQVDWEFAPQWSMTAGLRHTWDEKDVTESIRQVCFGVTAFGCTPIVDAFSYGALSYSAVGNDVTPIFVTGGGVGSAPGVVSNPTINPLTGYMSRRLHGEWGATTGTLGLQFRPNDDGLLYARYSRGYKSGGFNAGTLEPSPQTNPEFVDAYEFGWRQTFGSRFMIDTSLFLYNYEGAQVPLTVRDTTTHTLFVNIPETQITGLEVSAMWSPIEDLQLMANYAYLHTEITQSGCYLNSSDTGATLSNAQPGGCALVGANQFQSVVGRALPQAPENRITLNGTYRFRFEPGDLLLSATYIWRDDSFNDLFETAAAVSHAYDQVDLRATWSTHDDRVSLIAFGRNVFDEEGSDGATSARNSLGILNTTYNLTPPRTYGVELQVRY